MAARAALFSLLKEDPTLLGLGLQEVYPTNALDTPPEEFFAVISWGVTTSSFGTVGSDRVSVWFHDRQRDYGRINDALKHIKALIPSVVHRPGDDGYTLSTAEWDGESQDLFDPGYQTVARYGDFTVVSRYPSS